jgi:aminodeoxyfutalosine deaminase
VFSGYCDGVDEARERFGIEMRLTPDIPRGWSIEEAEATARWAVRFRDRGVVGLGLGGPEAGYPPEPFARAFAIARDGGVGSVPHAGEVAGEASIRGCLDVLHADRLRHGIRAVESPALVAELAARGVVLDVCPTSNLCTGAVASLESHPLPALIAAGVRCTVNTDDPAMFGTNLAREHEVAVQLGADAAGLYAAGVEGALCDETTRERLRTIGQVAFPESPDVACESVTPPD